MFRRSATMSGYEGRLISAMATPVSTAVLKAVPLFASVPEEQLRMLTVVVTRKSVSRSTTIMAGGDATDSLYIVLSGRLKVMMSDSEGKEVILAILGPGEFFGEMGLIDDSPRSASVVAMESCELLSVTKRDFKKCLAENFEMSMAVMRGLVRRLREADRKIGSLALLDVYGRVARLLLDMSETVNGEKVVTKRLPKQDIAKMIVATFHRGDPGWSHSATGGVARNAGGVVGALVSDVALYLFGLSAYWWVALCVYVVVWGYRRLNGTRLIDRRPLVLALAGFAVLLVSSAALERLRLHSLPVELPLAPGGLIGNSVGALTGAALGFTGATLVLLTLAAVGFSLFTGISWIAVAEVVGAMLEAGYGFAVLAWDRRRDRK